MKRMQSSARRGRGASWLGVLALSAVLTTACSPGGREDYAKDGDTGQAAPAASPDQSTAKMIGPDSGPAAGQRTGQRGVAGDTLTAQRPAAGISDSTVRAGADSARRGRPPR